MTTINLKRYYPYMTENVMLEHNRKNSQKTKMHFAVLSAPKMKGKFNM